MQRARELAKRLVIVDGHIDVPYRLYEGRDGAGKLTEDVTERTEKGDFDWPRAVEGGLDAPFMSIYVPAKYQKQGGAKRLADELIDIVVDIAARAPKRFLVARTPAEVRYWAAKGKIALLLGIENGAALEGRIENVAHFHGRGVRYVTLTHGKDNDLGDSSYDESRTHKGLSELGRRVVAEMNRLGMMVDVSHVSDATLLQVLAHSRAPVIASHSSCRHFTPGFERNVSDDLIREIAARGGVVMLNFGSAFLDDAARRAWDAAYDEAEALAGKLGVEPSDARVKAFWRERQGRLPRVTVERVADHVDHVVKLVGIEHVGLGSDFDGVGASLPHGLEDVSRYPNLLYVLLRRGYTEEQLDKICSGNVLRVWEAVEEHARPKKKDKKKGEVAPSPSR
jgi:membrane dipeptidase